METKYLGISEKEIEYAGNILSDGGLVAFPTETVYGLGANALNENAVKSIYEAKGRPSDNPLIVHISGIDEIEKLAYIENDVVKLICENFWPGPLTIVLPKKDVVPYKTTGGLDTVAIRIPANDIAQKIIKSSGVPIAAPSANLSGKPSPTSWKHVSEDMDGRIDAVIKGEKCAVGIESTVIEINKNEIIILRPGIITAEDIQSLLVRNSLEKIIVKYDKALIDKENKEKPKAPGMKYKHYAPKGQLIIIKGSKEKVEAKIEELKNKYSKENKNVGVIFFENLNKEQIAEKIFCELRDMDNMKKEIILLNAVDDTDGIGFAIMNRLSKAAGNNIIKV